MCLRPWEVIGKKLYFVQQMTFFSKFKILFFFKNTTFFQKTSRKAGHFRPSRRVETLRDEMSSLKSGLNISGLISRPQIWLFFEF